MGIKQYRVGKEWEKAVMKYYRNKGYFTYKVPTELEGTVFDIICIRDASAMCIECKHVTGKKLYFRGSGLSKKYDELEHFVMVHNTNVYLYIKSDELDAIYWTTWVRSGELLKEQGYLDLEKDCIKATI